MSAKVSQVFGRQRFIDLDADDAAKVSAFHSLWVGKAGGELLQSRFWDRFLLGHPSFPANLRFAHERITNAPHIRRTPVQSCLTVSRRYALDCVKLAEQPNTSSEIRERLLQMARERMQVAMEEEEAEPISLADRASLSAPLQ